MMKFKKKPETDWCDYKGHIIGKKPKHIRYPKCRRRLIPRTFDCEPFSTRFEPIYVFPLHKIPYSKK